MFVTQKCERYLDEANHTKAPEFESEPFQRYEAMLEAFAAMVRGELENPYTLDYELTLFRTILQACGMEVDQ